VVDSAGRLVRAPGVLEPVALVSGIDNPTAVREAVERGAGSCPGGGPRDLEERLAGVSGTVAGIVRELVVPSRELTIRADADRRPFGDATGS